ncbi:hypothetical protein PROAA_1030013 [Candidatus Propionivibrio aalborgensis]|uniref:Uncharacterized protein n=1 Tax=Candidatus Propionivibrio aalborgensis TaxID=1860101 RepID=A0A1A8XG50_9RHOO|nr:hypothetical protein PROAA_1030013 [Candidatus Propionivibrio aalborgensis]
MFYTLAVAVECALYEFLQDGRAGRRPETPFFVPQVLGQTLWHRALLADDARRDGRARLGFLRHHPGDRRRLRRSSEFRHGAGRPSP